MVSEEKILMKIAGVINGANLDITIGPIMYHCEDWGNNPKPTAAIIEKRLDGTFVKLGNIELN